MAEPLSLREIQLEELAILKKLTDFYAEHGIRYILCGGTMLGAVRHNGFIPWDDDIDMLVPRDDYEKLKALYREGADLGDGIRLKLPGDSDSAYPFIKAVNTNFVAMERTRDDKHRAHLWIDVFPMDHFPDDEETHRQYVKKIKAMGNALTAATLSKEYLRERGYYRDPLKFLKLVAARVICAAAGGPAKLAARIDRTAREMDRKFKSSDHVGDGAWPNGMKDYFPMRAVEPVMQHEFEGYRFSIPENYDEYLTLFYGNYMRIPPVEERQDHHIEVYRAADR